MNSNSNSMIVESRSTTFCLRWFSLWDKYSRCLWLSSTVASMCRSSVASNLYNNYYKVINWNALLRKNGKYPISVAAHAEPCAWIRIWKIPKPLGIYWKCRQNSNRAWMWLEFRWSRIRPSQWIILYSW